MDIPSRVRRVTLLPAVSRSILYPRAMYFWYYVALGSFLPFINLYYQRMGLSGVQIGALAALPAIVSSAAAFGWSALADARHWHRRVLRASLLLSPLVMLLLSQAAGFALLLALVVTLAFVAAPIVPLLDSTALEASETHRRDYGEMRVWGTIGWVVASLLSGWVVEQWDIHWLFYGYALFMTVAFFVSAYQPARVRVLQSSLRHGLRELLARRDLLLFLISMFLLAVTTGGINYFFSIYLAGLGASEGLIGLAWALSAVSEIPVFLWSGPLVRRVGPKGLLAFSLTLYAARWLMYSFIHAPGWAVAVTLLHGLSFATFLVGGVTFVNERAPAGLSATAQSIFNATTFGLGPFAGALVGGAMYDAAGMVTVFRVMSALALAGLAVFGLAGRVGVETSPPTATSP